MNKPQARIVAQNQMYIPQSDVLPASQISLQSEFIPNMFQEQ